MPSLPAGTPFGESRPWGARGAVPSLPPRCGTPSPVSWRWRRAMLATRWRRPRPAITLCREVQNLNNTPSRPTQPLRSCFTHPIRRAGRASRRPSDSWVPLQRTRGSDPRRWPTRRRLSCRSTIRVIPQQLCGTQLHREPALLASPWKVDRSVRRPVRHDDDYSAFPTSCNGFAALRLTFDSELNSN